MTKVSFGGMNGSRSTEEQPGNRHVIFSTLTHKLNIGELVRPRDLRGDAFNQSRASSDPSHQQTVA